MTTTGPIFILGLQRGGTNQPLNIFRSHPAVYWPRGEFHQPFRPRRTELRKDPVASAIKLLRYAPIWLTRGDLLDIDTPPRGSRRLSGIAARALRSGLAGSARGNADVVNAHKTALRERGFHTDDQAPDRMLVKVMNYNVGLVPDLLEIYPDARFVGIIRDGRGVCEGQIARGASVEQATALYNQFGRWLREYEAAGLPLRTWRFEDLLADPAGVSQDMYAFCGLDPRRARGVMMQDKHRIVDARNRIVGIEKRDSLYAFSELGQHMRLDTNAASLARLSPRDRAAIDSHCGAVLRRFGYLDPAESTSVLARSAPVIPAQPEAIAS